MIRIELWWPGKTKLAFCQLGIEEYIKRAQQFSRLEIVVLNAGKGKKNKEQSMLDEENALLRILKSDKHFLILLDERGQTLDTEAFSEFLEEFPIQHRGLVPVFAVGGAHGFTHKIKDLAQKSIRLSALTLPHDLARLLICEQLYRALSIISGHPYHKA